MSFLKLANYTKAHRTKVRARETKIHRVTIEAPTTLTTGRETKTLHPVRKNLEFVHLFESMGGSDLLSAYSNYADAYERVFFARGNFVEESDRYGDAYNGYSGTSTVRKPMYTHRSDLVLSFRDRERTPAPWIPVEDKGTSFQRPSWMERSPVQGMQLPHYSLKKRGLICYHFYEKGHSASTCSYPFDTCTEV